MARAVLLAALLAAAVALAWGAVAARAYLTGDLVPLQKFSVFNVNYRTPLSELPLPLCPRFAVEQVVALPLVSKTNLFGKRRFSVGFRLPELSQTAMVVVLQDHFIVTDINIVFHYEDDQILRITHTSKYRTLTQDEFNAVHGLLGMQGVLEELVDDEHMHHIHLHYMWEAAPSYRARDAITVTFFVTLLFTVGLMVVSAVLPLARVTISTRSLMRDETASVAADAAAAASGFAARSAALAAQASAAQSAAAPPPPPPPAGALPSRGLTHDGVRA